MRPLQLNTPDVLPIDGGKIGVTAWKVDELVYPHVLMVDPQGAKVFEGGESECQAAGPLKLRTIRVDLPGFARYWLGMWRRDNGDLYSSFSQAVPFGVWEERPHTRPDKLFVTPFPAHDPRWAGFWCDRYSATMDGLMVSLYKADPKLLGGRTSHLDIIADRWCYIRGSAFSLPRKGWDLRKPETLYF